ncbi:type II toxin-antitoxin system RelE/ParE family toxin [bacterium]|nr:type II toxin-antitoxin system RelE/ParE family toxin [bacterium]
MKGWKVLYAESIEKDLTKISPDLAEKIIDHIDNVLALDPLNHSKPLLGRWRKFWVHRYRKNWRIIFKPIPREKTSVIYYIQHRKLVYKKRQSG